MLVHKTEISDMAGIGRKMPWTMGAFFVGSLCIIGIPPTGGSWSKWYLLMSAADANVWLMGVLLISSLFSIGYLMPVVTTAFFKPLPPRRIIIMTITTMTIITAAAETSNTTTSSA